MIKYVKDKSNLLSFNQWSAGEYLNNFTGFLNMGTDEREISTEYSYIGNKSIKLYHENTKLTMFDIHEEISQEDIGRTLTVKCNCIKLYGNSKMQLLFYNGSTLLNAYDVNFSSNDFEEYSLSKEIPDNTTLAYIRFRDDGNSSSFVIDNIVAIIS